MRNAATVYCSPQFGLWRCSASLRRHSGLLWSSRRCESRGQFQRLSSQMSRLSWALAVGALVVLSPVSEALEAQYIIGVVRDTLGKNVEGALVTLVDSTRRVAGAVRSNSTGHFRLRAPEHAYYSVVVRALGYELKATHWVEIDSLDAITADIQLVPAVTTLAPVRVESGLQGLRGVRALGLNPRAIGGRVVTPEEVLNHAGGARDYQDIIRSLAVPWIGFHNGAKCLTYRRGMGNRCMRTYVDGLRVDSLWTTSMSVPPEIIDHIIILRPTEGAVLYGGNSTDGVILIYTKEGRP